MTMSRLPSRLPCDRGLIFGLPGDLAARFAVAARRVSATTGARAQRVPSDVRRHMAHLSDGVAVGVRHAFLIPASCVRVAC